MIENNLKGKLTAAQLAKTSDDKVRELLGAMQELAKIVEDQDRRIKVLEKK